MLLHLYDRDYEEGARCAPHIPHSDLEQERAWESYICIQLGDDAGLRMLRVQEDFDIQERWIAEYFQLHVHAPAAAQWRAEQEAKQAINEAIAASRSVHPWELTMSDVINDLLPPVSIAAPPNDLASA